MDKFEPVIIGFVCNECVYAAADLAGTFRLSYPPNVRLIRVPCSGQVDAIHILRAFESGADGVFVGGCLDGQCHYFDGNSRAQKRVGFLREILKAMGLEEERLSIHLLSASMAQEFAHLVNELTATVRKLGPSPLSKHKATLVHNQKKRELLRDTLLNISHGLKGEANDYKDDISGYGDVVFDTDECLGCGACGYVCKDGAITVDTSDDKIIIKNTYWKCTACGRCAELCPKECMNVRGEFDLARFLGGEEEVKVTVGMTACERCGKMYLPAMLVSEIETMLADNERSSSFIGLCPTCRKFSIAEKMKIVRGVAGEGLGASSFISSEPVNQDRKQDNNHR